MPQNTEQRPVLSDKGANHECPVQSDITSLTSSRPNSEVPGGAEVVPFPRPVWSAPVLTEATGADRDELLKILAQIPIEIPM